MRKYWYCDIFPKDNDVHMWEWGGGSNGRTNKQTSTQRQLYGQVNCILSHNMQFAYNNIKKDWQNLDTQETHCRAVIKA